MTQATTTMTRDRGPAASVTGGEAAGAVFVGSPLIYKVLTTVSAL